MIVDFIGQHYHTVSDKVQYCKVTFTFQIKSNSMLFDYIRIGTFVIVISSLKQYILMQHYVNGLLSKESAFITLDLNYQ